MNTFDELFENMPCEIVISWDKQLKIYSMGLKDNEETCQCMLISTIKAYKKEFNYSKAQIKQAFENMLNVVFDEQGELINEKNNIVCS
ncbi:MAG: hypothetical protein ACPKOI_05690 [Pleomorphochaeta sp.]